MQKPMNLKRLSITPLTIP